MPLGRSKSVLCSLLTFCADQLEWCSPRRLHSVSSCDMFACHKVKGASNARQVPVKVDGGCDCHHDLPD